MICISKSIAWYNDENNLKIKKNIYIHVLINSPVFCLNIYTHE